MSSNKKKKTYVKCLRCIEMRRNQRSRTYTCQIAKNAYGEVIVKSIGLTKHIQDYGDIARDCEEFYNKYYRRRHEVGKDVKRAPYDYSESVHKPSNKTEYGLRTNTIDNGVRRVNATHLDSNVMHDGTIPIVESRPTSKAIANDNDDNQIDGGEGSNLLNTQDQIQTGCSEQPQVIATAPADRKKTSEAIANDNDDNQIDGGEGSNLLNTQRQIQTGCSEQPQVIATAPADRKKTSEAITNDNDDNQIDGGEGSNLLNTQDQIQTGCSEQPQVIATAPADRKETLSIENEGPNASVVSPEDERRKRRRTSLRSVEADLKVIVGQDTGEEDEGRETKVFWHFSQILATQSRYVDNVLSTTINTGNDSNPSKHYKEIVFDGIRPEQWEGMMRFITNPLAFRSMTMSDAIELAPLYAKYEFPIGVQICDEVLGTVFMKVHNSFELEKQNTIIDAIVLAKDINLKKAFHCGRLWIKRGFEVFDRTSLLCFPFKATHINRLVPIIIRDGELQMHSDVFGDRKIDVDAMMEHLDEGGDEVRVNLIGCIDRYAHADDLADLTNPMFASLLFANMEISFARRCSQIQTIYAVFDEPQEPHPASGSYFLNRDTGNYSKSFNGSMYEIKKCPRDRNWFLTCDNKNLFECKYRFCNVPTKDGWSSCSDEKSLKLRLDY